MPSASEVTSDPLLVDEARLKRVAPNALTACRKTVFGIVRVAA
jgi:hypothetical protein